MKITTIKCDYCKDDITDSNEYLEIGSNSGQDFMFSNHMNGSNKLQMSRYRNLHFCKNEHFTAFFLGKNLPK